MLQNPNKEIVARSDLRRNQCLKHLQPHPVTRLRWLSRLWPNSWPAHWDLQ